jgi:hypothetical protein
VRAGQPRQPVLQAASIIDTLNYLLDLKRKAEFLSAVVARDSNASWRVNRAADGLPGVGLGGGAGAGENLVEAGPLLIAKA